MIRADKFSVFIFAVTLTFYCCNGRYLLVETEDDIDTNEGGDELQLMTDMKEDKLINRDCDFCQPDVPGVDGHGIGK